MRLFLFCFLLITIYAAYHDIAVGTFATNRWQTDDKTNYYITKIEPGDTVLSIIERQEEKLPVAIEDVVTDFEKLNGITPEKIRIGQSYKFKDY